MDRVLVTGATGNVGREVVRALLGRGVQVRAAGRREAVRELFGPDVEAVRLDFRDARTFHTAAVGCTALFLVRPPAISNTKETLNPFIDAARDSGVAHVVFLSVAGAGSNKIVPHHAVEVHLASRGRDWTLLRPGFFAQNLGDAYLRDIREEDRLYVPAGQARVAFVDVRDVAEVAALVFGDALSHRAKAYTLTGPEAITFNEAAQILSAYVGRPIQYVPASVVGYLLHLRRRGMPFAQAIIQAILHVGLRFGQAESVDPTARTLLGRNPRTMHDYVRDYSAAWVV